MERSLSVEDDDEALAVRSLMLLSASKVTPQVSAASPMTAITCSGPLRRSRAGGHADGGGRRGAAAWPRPPNESWSLSIALQEAVEAPGGADLVELGAVAAGEQLVDVTLVRHVEREAVFRRVEHAVHRQRGARRRRDWGPMWPPFSARSREDDALTNFGGESGELLDGETFDIGGRLDGRKNGHGLRQKGNGRVVRMMRGRTRIIIGRTGQRPRGVLETVRARTPGIPPKRSRRGARGGKSFFRGGVERDEGVSPAGPERSCSRRSSAPARNSRQLFR